MHKMNKTSQITVETVVNKDAQTVWDFWTKPKHIFQWSHASDDWHTPYAENDLRVGGKFLCRMQARNGSGSFDFIGTYDKIKTEEFIEYTIIDGRKVSVIFKEIDGKTEIVETFEPENENSIEMQKQGWQSILDNFKKYVENN